MRRSLESGGYRADGREIKRGSSTLCTSWRRSSVGNGPLFVPASFIRLISAPMIHSPFPKRPNRRRRTTATRTRVQLVRHASFCLRASSVPSSAPVGHVSHVLSFFRSETTETWKNESASQHPGGSFNPRKRYTRREGRRRDETVFGERCLTGFYLAAPRRWPHCSLMLAKLAKSGVADESGTVSATFRHLVKNVPRFSRDAFGVSPLPVTGSRPN